MLTNPSGQVVWRAGYQAYGQAALNAGNTIDFHVRFPGQYYDEETDLHYNRFRYYEPSSGRYVRGDPLGQAVGANVYVYVGNAPLAWVDPLGLECRAPGQFGHGRVVGGPVPAWIADLPPKNGKQQVATGTDSVPPPGADVDFIYVNGRWTKIKDGDYAVNKNDDGSYTIAPICLPNPDGSQPDDHTDVPKAPVDWLVYPHDQQPSAWDVTDFGKAVWSGIENLRPPNFNNSPTDYLKQERFRDAGLPGLPK